MIDIDITDPNVSEIVQGWRTVHKNNKAGIPHLFFEVSADQTDERFLPRILVGLGFFESTSQVKKNRPDLWRDAEFEICERVKLSWATLEIWFEDI